MECPRCGSINSIENQHGLRLVCVMCGLDAEPAGQSIASKEAMRAKIEKVK